MGWRIITTNPSHPERERGNLGDRPGLDGEHVFWESNLVN